MAHLDNRCSVMYSLYPVTWSFTRVKCLQTWKILFSQFINFQKQANSAPSTL